MNKNFRTQDIIGKVFIGTVVSNSRSGFGAKQLQVRIPELDEGVADSDLPWSGIGRPLFRGGGKGSMGATPQVGSKVAGVCDKGDRNAFIALWEIDDPSTTNGGWSVQTWGMEDENGSCFKVDVGGDLLIQHQGATIRFSGGNIIINGTRVDIN